MTPEELKKWRKSTGLTQQQMADIFPVRRETLARWENGTRAMPAWLKRWQYVIVWAYMTSLWAADKAQQRPE
jgi:transcriptional regulator with XRE-family HTH domain